MLSPADALLLEITGDPTVFPTGDKLPLVEELKRRGLITFTRNMDRSRGREVILEVICRLTPQGKAVQQRLRDEEKRG